MNRYVKGTLKVAAVVVVVVAVVVLPLLFRSRDTAYHSPTLFAMDTTLDITLEGRSKEQAKGDVAASFALVENIESLTSRFNPGSEVSRINEGAGVAPVEVSAETLDIIKNSLEYSRLTDGAFDITIAPVAKLWGFYDQNYRVPTPEEVAQARSLVDWRKVTVDEQNGTVMLTDKGMEIDLGGVAKGYAQDAVYDLLKDRGVEHGLVNFGGSVGAIGRKTDGKKWVVGIKDPRGETGTELLGEITAENEFVSSSGDYERFFERGGKRYFHIFNPSTGYNPEGVISTTVVGPNGKITDILSTSVLVLGKEKGLALLETLKNYQGLAVGSDGGVSTTPGFEAYVITIKEHV